MPKTFPQGVYFRRVVDDSVPENTVSANIVLNEEGLREMAVHYKEKYNIDIFVFSGTMQSGAGLLNNLLHEAKQKNTGTVPYRCGFIFIDTEAGQYGHAMPIIYEKNEEGEALFLLDSGQFLGSTQVEGKSSIYQQKLEQARAFRKNVLDGNPDIALWSHIGKRQVDDSSCGVDALVTVKDGLRISPSLSSLAEQKRTTTNDNVTHFYMPEELMKTAQIGSFPAHSQADMSKEMHTHREKNQGQLTGQQYRVTLQEFRKKYDAEVKVTVPVYQSGVKRSLFEKPIGHREETKTFGTYTLYKGHKIAATLEERWNIRQQKEIISLLNQASSGTDSGRNGFLDILKNETSSSSLEKLATLLEAVTTVLYEKDRFPVETCKQAESIIEILTTMCADPDQPNVQANFDGLLNNSSQLDRDTRSLLNTIVENAESLKSNAYRM